MLGLILDERLGDRPRDVLVISPKGGRVVAEVLRAAGYAVTDLFRRGKEGGVEAINGTVRRKDMTHVQVLAGTLTRAVFYGGRD